MLSSHPFSVGSLRVGGCLIAHIPQRGRTLAAFVRCFAFSKGLERKHFVTAGLCQKVRHLFERAELVAVSLSATEQEAVTFVAGFASFWPASFCR